MGRSLKAQEATRYPPIPRNYIIPLVYPTQSISVPTQAILKGLEDAGISGVDIDESLKATLKEGNKNRKTPWEMLVESANAHGYRVSGIGHAGLCIIDSEKKQAHYFEYGRYDKKNIGVVRWGKGFENKNGISITLAKNYSLPEAEELRIKHLLAVTNYKKPHPFFGLKFEIPKSKAQEAIKHLTELVGQRWEQDYDLNGHHCYSFAKEICNKFAGEKLDSDQTLDMEFRNSVGESVDGFMNKAKLAVASAAGTTTFGVPSFSLWEDKIKKWSANSFEHQG